MSFIPNRVNKLFGSRQRIGFLICVALLILTDSTVADDWAFFRGPNCDGTSTETGWTHDWPETGPKVSWRADVGIGASSMVVAGDHVITMGSNKQENLEIIWCLDAHTGSPLWQYSYPAEFDARQFEGGPGSTPTIDGEFVYTLGYLGHAHCLNIEDGQVEWSKHLIDDFGGRYSIWKYAGSPLVIDDFVIFDTGADGGASTVALDKKTGDKIWGEGSDLAGYSTPIPFDDQGRRGVLVFKARSLVAHDLTSGQEMWRIEWRTNYDCNASSPTVFGDKLFVSTGYGGHRARGALFQLGEDAPREIWINPDLETRMNSAVIHDGYGYCVSEQGRGQLICFDMRDGAVAWSEPSFNRYGTLMIADGRLIVLDERGDLVIADAESGGYHELARAKVLDGRSWVAPVLANGHIFAKNNAGNIVCLDVRSEVAE
jgi:outer membrane protein assembly factor BamB